MILEFSDHIVRLVDRTVTILVLLLQWRRALRVFLRESREESERGVAMLWYLPLLSIQQSRSYPPASTA
jgi:hypothetical protein